jgi:NAD(P)-dependent dehydrogenase (short-subunit alcohol dehydrogenase family)
MPIPDVSGRTLADLWSLRGRVAVVTGAGQGIGAAIAGRLGEAGATVVVSDLDAGAAAATAEATTNAHGVRAVAMELDVAEAGAAAAVAARLVDELGRLDVWVNNAGVFPKDDFLEIDAERWDRVQQINLRGTFLGAQAAAARMIEAGRGGVIVNVASVAGLRGGWPGYTHYVASKHGVIGLTRSLASELGPHGIRAVGVAPSAIETPGVMEPMDDGGEFFRNFAATLPLGRSGVPDDIARVVLFLASDLASFMTGTTLVVDAGNTAR